MSIPVIAIFDIGKTNKKLFLFDKSYRIIFEKSVTLPETTDEDGDTCENLEQLINFIHESLQEVLLYKYYDLHAINFSAYGASLVYLDAKGKPMGPLYNYLKPYPKKLQDQFYETYHGEAEFSRQTASPVLGSLNSGMQLYRLKHEKPSFYSRISCALHLPQFLSYLITRQTFSDISSIGCHTNLWDFAQNDYHHWVTDEGLSNKLAPVVQSDHMVEINYEGHAFLSGVGLHDSSAALIPYQVNFSEPFILLSTGTWCISLNPFNDIPLTDEELAQDCLCYLSYTRRPVKASRLFSGYEYDQQIKRISTHFKRSLRYYQSLPFNADLIRKIKQRTEPSNAAWRKESLFASRDLSEFTSDEEAYHQLMYDLVLQQYYATQLVLKGTTVKRIFVDGGFSKNPVFMNLMAMFFSEIEIYAASMAHGTALGSALAIHHIWNDQPVPGNLIELTYYGKHELVV